MHHLFIFVRYGLIFGVCLILTFANDFRTLKCPIVQFKYDKFFLHSTNTFPNASPSPSLASPSPSSTPVCVDIFVPLGKSLGLMNDAAIFAKNLNCSRIITNGFEALTSTSKIALFLEIIQYGGDVSLKDRIVWLMANTEWLTTKDIYNPETRLIICKTLWCLKMLRKEKKENNGNFSIVYTKFSSLDFVTQLDKVEMNYTNFIHASGKSRAKNTRMITDLWHRSPHFPQLTFVGYDSGIDHFPTGNLPPNMIVINKFLEKEEHEKLMLSNGVHLAVSSVEGYGHSINEARKIGALVITTDLPPMNELINSTNGLLVGLHGTFHQQFSQSKKIKIIIK